MMAKTHLPRVSVINALKKYVGVTGSEISKLGTSEFKFVEKID